MAFEARSLRVQLPCGSVTVIDAERQFAENQARLYWRGMLTPAAVNDPSCGPGTSCGFHSGVDLCFGSDPVDVLTVVDATVLPVLRAQLESRLKEINAALEAVEKKTRT
jgi:hypothetical protein